MKNRSSILLLSLLAASALAQDTLEEEQQPEVRSYTVEIIIFSYAQGISAGSEIFVPDTPPVEELLPGDGEIEPIQLDIRESSIEERLAQADDQQYELVMLPEEDFGLLETYEHLERLDAYEPLMHFGWTQATYPDEAVAARSLSSFATPPDGLSGELTLYLSRYLHLAIKLQLDASVESKPENVADRFSFEDRFDSFRDFGDEETDHYPIRYRIEEDRIFRNGELRYFDHPKFGVLARVTRVVEENPEESELPVEMEMLGE